MSDASKIDRGEAILDAIYADVDRRLNPNCEDCWHCGGEGVTYDCFDGFCEEADYGCPDCARPCLECRINAGNRAKAIRKEVIAMSDVDVARAWLKSIGRWSDDITPERIMASLEAAKEKADALIAASKSSEPGHE